MEELMQLRGLQYPTSFLEDVPLLVTSGVITPISGVITRVIHL